MELLDDLDREAYAIRDGLDEIMQFTLVWQGKLRSSGNKSKAVDVDRIRRELSPQFAELWNTHRSLLLAREMAYRPIPGRGAARLVTGDGDQNTPRVLYEQRPDEMEDLCKWLPVGNSRFKPLVRESMHLNCDIYFTFLRQGDPGMLVNQGGDLDGRLKTLLDALKMPSKDEMRAAGAEDPEDLYCLAESDALVVNLEFKTDRLLLPPSSQPHEAFVMMKVYVNVLQVDRYNLCLVSSR